MPNKIKKETAPVLSLDNVTLRFPEKILCENLSFQIHSNEHWAVVGPSGSGKTTLLQAIAGKHYAIAGAIRYHFFEDFVVHHKVDDPLYNFRRQIAMVSFHHNFKNRSNTRDFFYQQRYQSVYADEAVSVQEYLENIIAEEKALHLPEKFTMDWVTDQLHLRPLLGRSLIKLSSGETRRLLIGAALLRQPRLLLLDNPFVGLDASTRKFFYQFISEISHREISLIMATTPEEIPQSFTHILALGENGKYHAKPREKYVDDLPETSEQPQYSIEKDLFAKLASHNEQYYAFKNAITLNGICVRLRIGNSPCQCKLGNKKRRKMGAAWTKWRGENHPSEFAQRR